MKFLSRENIIGDIRYLLLHMLIFKTNTLKQESTEKLNIQHSMEQEKLIQKMEHKKSQHPITQS